jgi:GNAT superfamily N-acetyltransferase
VTDPQPDFAPPALLTEAHDSTSFACGESVLDDWLRHRAWDNMQVAASRTYVVCRSGSNRISGYFALSMGQILATDVIGSMRRNIPRHIPAVVLGRLAIDRISQGQGLGRALLAEVLRRSVLASAEVSARLVSVHAISAEAEAFYLHHGFTRLPGENPTLAVDLVKYQKIGLA